MDSASSEFTKIIHLINELLITYDEIKYTKIIDYLRLKNQFQKDLLNHFISLTDCNLKFRLLGFYYKNLILYSDSFKWYLIGAKLNNIVCINNIANYYSNGYGVKQDHKIAFEWYKKGAELNDVSCIHNIAICYSKGYGIEKDYKIAFEWYKKAAELNYAESIHTIGIFYEYGFGIEKNCNIALEWYTKGAEQEYETSINSFIRLFENDYKIEHIENYKNKINTNIIANYKLGLIYEQQKNTIEALKCFAKIIQIAKSITWKEIAQTKIREISANLSVEIALYILKLGEENNKIGKELDDFKTEISTEWCLVSKDT